MENAKNAQEKFEEIRDRIRIAEENLVKEQGRKESVRNRRESLSSEMSELKIKSAELAKDHESSQRELETLKSGMTDTAENLGRLSEEEKKLGTGYQRKKMSLLKNANSSWKMLKLLSKLVMLI